MIVHIYLVAPPWGPPSAADIETARRSITLGTALGLYVVVFIFAFVGLGAVVIALKIALHTKNSKALNKALWLLGITMWVCWCGLLDRISRTIEHFPTNGAAILALLFGPPLLGVGAILGVRMRDRRQNHPPTTGALAND
jgi:apolipoprotein N-acyltransferase